MGAAASTNKSKSSDSIVIALKDLHLQMRLFQHKVSGEVIVLFNDDVNSFFDNHTRNQYDEAVLSSEQEIYLRQLKVFLSVPSDHVNVIQHASSSPASALHASALPPTPSAINVKSPPMVTFPDQDVVRKRVSTLRNLSFSEKDGGDGIGSTAAIGGEEAHNPSLFADAKSSSNGRLDQKDSKNNSGSFLTAANNSASGNYRKYVPHPYYTPLVFQQDSRLVEEFHSQGFTEVAAKESHSVNSSQRRSEKVDESDSQDLYNNSSSPNNTSGGPLSTTSCLVCKSCHATFFGQSAAEALEDHQHMCSPLTEVRRRIEDIDDKLDQTWTGFQGMKREQLQTIISTALTQAADELDKAQVLFDRINKFVKKVVSLQAATVNDRYLLKLREVLELEIQSSSQSLADLTRDARSSHYVIDRYQNCLTILKEALLFLKDKQSVLRSHPPIKLAAKDFKFLRLLGKGGFGSVYLARRLDTRKLCAIKVLNKESIRQANCQTQIVRERMALTVASRYPDFFVRFFSSFQSKRHLFIVMEYIQGGDCLTLLTSLKRFPQVVAQHFIAQVCLAVRHLHRNGVVHRDIKPDNILITSLGHAKLGDFGLIVPYTRGGNLVKIQPVKEMYPPSLRNDFNNPYDMSMNGNNLQPLSPSAEVYHAREHRNWLDEESSGLFASHVKGESKQAHRDLMKSGSMFQDLWSTGSDSSLFLPPSFDDRSRPGGDDAQAEDKIAHRKLRSVVGNYNYACPELVLRRGYDHSVDWWAVAVLCFHFLAGVTPFEGETAEQTMDNIVSTAANWNLLPPQTTDEARSFIGGIISHANPEDRLGYVSSDEVLGHSFFSDIDFKQLYQGYGPIFPQLKPSSGGKTARGDYSQSQSQSFSASFTVDQDTLEDDEIELFSARVPVEAEESDLRELVALEQGPEIPDAKLLQSEDFFDFEDFDCLYA